MLFPTTAPQAPLHITPYGSGWAVRRADEGEPLSAHADFDDALVEGRRVARSGPTDLVIFDKDWHVAAWHPATRLAS